MSPEQLNREVAESRLERLLAEYEDVTVGERTWELPPDEFAEHLGYARDGYIGGGYCWVVRTPERAPALSETMPAGAADDGTRVLLILGRGTSRWGVPGGGREGDETFEEAAVREVREETDVDCAVTGCFRIERTKTVSTGGDGTVAHGLSVGFEAAYEGGTVSIQGGELNGAAWFAEPPARLHPFVEEKAAAWFGD